MEEKEKNIQEISSESTDVQSVDSFETENNNDNGLDPETEALIAKLENRIIERKAEGAGRGYLRSFEETLIIYDQMMINIARMSATDILSAFYKYKDSEEDEQKKIWDKVVGYISSIKQKRYNPFSYWSLTSKNRENYSALDVYKRKKLFADMEARGFENPEEVDIQSITIDTITKNSIELEEVPEAFKKIRNPKLTYDYELAGEERETAIITGTINLDSFLLTDGPGEFKWQARMIMESEQGKNLDLEKDQKIEIETFFDIDFNGRGLYRPDYRDPQSGLSSRFNHMDSDVFFENSKKYGLDVAWNVKKYGKEGELEEDDRFHLERLIQARLEKKIKDVMKVYMKNYVEPGKFETWETMTTKFNLESEISNKTEAEIDEMFKHGLETGEFDSMLLYIGEGAQKFLDITASEDYKVTNKEFLLMREHIDEIAGVLKDSSIYELGPGNGKKTKKLLEKVRQVRKEEGVEDPINYSPVDINPMMIYATAQEMTDLEGVNIKGEVCDFRKIKDKVDPQEKNSFLLLGNTLGNGDIEYQVDLLKDIKQAMKPGEKLFVGVQLKTDLEKIAEGYRGPELASLMKQMFTRFDIKEEDTDYQLHVDEANNQIVMALRFNEDKKVSYQGLEKEYKKGDEVTITVSHKYEDIEINEISKISGLKVVNKIMNKGQDYILVELEA